MLARRVNTQHVLDRPGKNGQPNENVHDFERLRANDFPSQFIRSGRHCQKETPGFDPVREPFAAQFAFFKLHPPGKNPDEHRLRNSRDDQAFFDARRE